MTYPMFDPLLDAVFVIGPKKEIYYCNEAAVNLFGLPRKRMTSGIPCYELVTFDDPDLFIMADGTKGEKKESPYREVNFLSASGKKGLVQVSILPTQELFGRNKLWFVYFHDVTLEETLHKKYRYQLEEKEKTIAKLKELQGASGAGPDLRLVGELREPLEQLKEQIEKTIDSIHANHAKNAGDPSVLLDLRPILETLKSRADQVLSAAKR